MSDEELAKEASDGDMKSFELLVGRYEQPLLRYASYLVGNLDDAEDIVQITFIKTFQNLKSYKHGRKFSSWIYRIAHNSAMDQVKRTRTINVDDKFMEKIAAEDAGIAAKIDRQIRADDVQKCIAKLKSKYRIPVLLFYFQRKSYAEISDILRLPVPTVGVRINRAKKLLREYCNKVGTKS